jgi:lipoate synthase
VLADGTATFMINGSSCTRACGFVSSTRATGRSTATSRRASRAVKRMGVAHAVVTAVATIS